MSGNHFNSLLRLQLGTVYDYLKSHPNLGEFTFLPVPVGKIFDIPDGPIIHPHTDLWAHRDSPTRQIARDWLLDQISKPRE
jgi:hypothetical protein